MTRRNRGTDHIVGWAWRRLGPCRQILDNTDRRAAAWSKRCRLDSARLVLLAGMVGLILTAPSGTARAENQAAGAHGKDDIALKHLHAAIDTAWNEGNARRFAGYWTEDGLLISPMGQTSRGRARIAKDIAAELVYLKGTTHKLTIGGISWPKPDVAVVDGEATIGNAHDQSGAPLPPLTANFTSVCVKQGGAWLVSYLVSYRFLKQ